MSTETAGPPAGDENPTKVGHEQLVALIDHTSAVIYMREYERLFKLRREDIVGLTGHDLFPEDIADDVLRRIRGHERTRSLPVVVLTTSNEERDIVESYRIGANGYVRKPVVFGEFVEAANVLGMYWLLVNQPAPLSRDD